MGNQDHVRWLREGVESWNRRRRETIFQPDFSGIRMLDELPVLLSRSNSDGRLDLRDINLAGADLSGSGFVATDLRRATLTSTDIRGADFRGSQLQGANLRGAKIDKKTDLRFASLVGANLSATSYGRAVLWREDGRNEASRLTPSTKVSDREVGSVNDLLEVCDTLDQHYESQGGGVTLYFRGEDEFEWKLRPSVFRSDLRDVIPEGEMLSDLVMRAPHAFTATHAVEDWIVAQHHGLRTRLLDITLNPSAALLFSCSTNHRKDGALHIFAIPNRIVEHFNSDPVSIIAHFAKLSPHDQEVLLGEDLLVPDYKEVLDKLRSMVRHEKPLFDGDIDPRVFFQVYVVRPRHTFDRIRAQSGAFLVSAQHRRFEASKIRAFNESIPIYDHYKLNVPSCRQSHILRQLQRLNVTRETLFPILDESAKAVNERFGFGSCP